MLEIDENILTKFEKNAPPIAMPISDPLVNSIQNAISTYLDNSVNMSLRGIATKDDTLNREYVRRLANGEIKSEKLDSEKVVRVLSIVSGKKKLNEIIDHFGEPISSFLRKSFNVQYTHETEIASVQIDEILSINEESCVAYSLISNKNGANSTLIQNILGDRGIAVANELTQKCVFEKTSDIYKLKQPNVIMPSISTCKKVFQYFSKFYNPAHYGKNRNYIIVKTGELNDDGLKAKQDLYRKFHLDLCALYDNSKFQGNNPSFDACMMDTFNLISGENENI